MPPDVWEEIKQKPPLERHRFERVWTLLGDLPPTDVNTPTTHSAWADLQHRLDAPPTPRRAGDRDPLSLNGRRPWLRLALAACIVGLLAGFWLWSQPVTVIAPRGGQQIVTLPDGSTVQLNSDSQIQYARGFQTWPLIPAETRVVTLQGEGFFDVTPSERPFEVRTVHARVAVLGTTFNVRARRTSFDDETRVTLASGSVRVSAHQDPSNTIVLRQPGQTARITAHAEAATVSRSDTENLDNVLIWRQQGFAVIDRPVAFVLAETERRFAITIEVQEGIALADSISVFLSRVTTASRILDELCLAQGCHYRETSQGFVLYSRDSLTD